MNIPTLLENSHGSVETVFTIIAITKDSNAMTNYFHALKVMEFFNNKLRIS